MIPFPSSILRGCTALLLLTAAPGLPRVFAAGRREQPLKLQLTHDPPRSNAPIRVRARLKWEGSALLEGRLEIVVRSGQERLCQYVSDELALTTGERVVDLLLPAVAGEAYTSQADIHTRFLTRRQTFAFEPSVWIVPQAFERSCLVGVVYAALERDEDLARAARLLGLEDFRPKAEGARRSSLSTRRARLTAEDLPVHPIGYCAFDILVVGGRAFSGAGTRPLKALGRWVKAGGSACILPSQTLQPRHVEFLNELTDLDGAVYTLDHRGRLAVTKVPAHCQVGDGVHLFRTSLGRTAVVLRPPVDDAALDQPIWRRLRAFLWKVRTKQLPAVVGGGAWQIDREEATRWHEMMANRGYYVEAADPTDPLPVHTMHAYNLDAIVTGLMPERVRLIPFSVIVLILVLFVVCIGPLDYYVLGLLRRRKYTWVLFPLTAVAFTFFTVQLAEHYMGREDHRRTFTFVDVDRHGKAVRQTRGEFIFSATERRARHQLRNCLFYPMERGQGGMFDPRFSPRAMRRGGYGTIEAGEAKPFPYEGRLPTHYIAQQTIHRWKPVMNKAFSLEPPEDMLELKWDAVSVRDFFSGDATRIVEGLLDGRGLRGAVYLLHGDEIRALSPSRTGRLDYLLQSPWTGDAAYSLLHVASARPAMGLFSVVSQLSPTGAGHFEDCAVLDTTDRNAWLLVVIEQRGDDVYIYRRLYRGGEERS